MTRKLLITGSNGFVATNLIQKCKQEGFLTVLFNPKTDKWHANRYREELELAANRTPIDAVIHLGAIASTRELNKEVLYGFNYEATTIIADFCVKRDIPMSFISTSAIYGNVNNSLSEYAKSKLKAEIYLNSNKNLKFTIFRLFNTYGFNEMKKENMKSVVSDMIISALTQNIIQIWQLPNLELGQQARDFIWVSDVTKILLCVTLQEPMDSQTVDLGTGQSVAFSELAELVKAEVRNTEIVPLHFPSEYDLANYQTLTKAKMNWLSSSNNDLKLTRVEEIIPELVFKYRQELNL
jgi:ADP-L-glycero-D-manno-heptose 6-epimerase